MAKQQEFQIEQIHEAVQTFLQPLGRIFAEWLVERALPEAIEEVPSRKKGFTRAEAADYIGFSVSSLDTARREKKIAEDYVLGSGKRQIPMFYKSTLDRYVDQHRPQKRKP